MATPPDPLADRISHDHVVFSKSWKSDLWLYLKNNHVFLSILLAHPKHIFTPIERRIVLLISLTFAAGLSCFFTVLESATSDGPSYSNTRAHVWLLNLTIGGLLQGMYDTLLGVSASCKCVQGKNNIIKCCCECFGKCAICAQLVFALIWFISCVILVNVQLAANGAARNDVLVQFIGGKMKGWVLDSIIFACLQFWWARRGQLKVSPCLHASLPTPCCYPCAALYW